MTSPLLIDGNTLTLEDVIDVARRNRSVVLSGGARERMADSRAWLLLGCVVIVVFALAFGRLTWRSAVRWRLATPRFRPP